MRPTKTEVEVAFDTETKLGVVNTAILIYSQLLFNHGVPMEQVSKLQDQVLEATVAVLTGKKDLVTVAAPTVH